MHMYVSTYKQIHINTYIHAYMILRTIVICQMQYIVLVYKRRYVLVVKRLLLLAICYSGVFNALQFSYGTIT